MAPAGEAISLLRFHAINAGGWLLGSAAPLWSATGRSRAGLFTESISQQGLPDPTCHRTLVQARHIFAFVACARLGWDGPWESQVSETTTALLDCARRADGFFVHSLKGDGSVLDGRADLYDQAFVILGLASAGSALGRPDLFDAAEALMNCIEAKWSHPTGGYREGEIVAAVRRQNPHMHLVEACLAFYEASGRTMGLDRAVVIARLAIDRFIDRHSGAMLEFFDDALNPVDGSAGSFVEPGHCFEWAWLFERLAHHGWSDGIAFADRLVNFARRHGIDDDRGVAINGLFNDGSHRDKCARLWPQCERLRVAIARLNRSGAAAEARDAAAAAEALERYLAVPIAGLWRDKLDTSGTWIDEPAPGSSLYHIAGAYSELILKRL